MLPAPHLSTPESQAKKPADVKAVDCVPTCLVEAVSVTVARNGDYLLLLRTDAGSGRFVVPASLGRGVFRITNPICVHVPAGKEQPIAKPSGQIL